jgi:hypothetical protein
MGRVERALEIPKSIKYDTAKMDAWEDSILKNPPTLGYVGADFFSEPGARPLDVGSSAESLLIELLRYVAREDTTFVRGRITHKRYTAFNVARALQRQRAGLTPVMRLSAKTPLSPEQVDSLLRESLRRMTIRGTP